MQWSTSGGSATRSGEGCSVNGISSTSSDYAVSTYTDHTAISGHDCEYVYVRAYAYAGTQSYWTSWDKEWDDAYVSVGTLLSAQHKFAVVTDL